MQRALKSLKSRRKMMMVVIIICVVKGPLSAQDDEMIRFEIDADSIPLEDLMAVITDQTSYHFSYSTREIDAEAKIPIRDRSAKLAEVLSWVDQSLNIFHTFFEGQIILNKVNEPSEIKEDIFTLSGYLSDSLSGESLIGATVQLEGSQRGAVTNAFGYYSIPLSEGSYTFTFSYIGYKSKIKEVVVNSDRKLDVDLDIQPLNLPNVVVILPISDLSTSDLGRVTMSSNDLNNIPEFGGESGLVKGLQTLPGVKGHGDGSAFFYTRGGDKDQNLIIIDDAPIFNPAHLFGFYSIVIPDFTKRVDVYKSDIPVSLGDRLSSIVSIRTKDGNLNKLKFSGALNPLVNRFSLELPTAKKKGSIFTSLRRSNLEWIYREDNPDANVAFGDFSFKWNHKIHEKDRLFFTLITSADQLRNDNDQAGGVNWGNAALTLRWNHLFGPRLFSNLILYSGAYNYRLFLDSDAWESGIGTASLKWDFTHISKSNITSRFGLEVAAYGFNPGRIASGNLLSLFPEIKERRARKRVIYYSSAFRPNPRWELKLGLRIPSWDNIGPEEFLVFNQSELIDTIHAETGPYNSALNLDPRASVRYEINDANAVKFSIGRYHQFLQLISNSQSPFSSLEVWLPSGPNIQPQIGDQMDLGFTSQIERWQSTFSLSGYYKKLRRQIDYRPHAQIFLNPRVEGELRYGTLEAYGIEMALEKKIGRLHGFLNYTWSRSLRVTPSLNGGQRYPAFQDRPHDFSGMIHYRFSPRVQLSAYYTIYSGSAFTSPSGFYSFNHQTVPLYDTKNNDRFPTYQRLDLALKFRLNKKADNKFQHSLNLSIYNALNRKNVVAINFNKILDGDGKPVIQTDYSIERNLTSTQVSLIPFFPSLTYKFSL